MKFRKLGAEESYEIELLIAKFLRVGVLIAGGLMAIGWLAQISFTQNVFEQFASYEVRPLRETLVFLWRTNDWAKLTAYLGLAALVSLPILRVLFTFMMFVRARERVLAAAALLVLLGLAVSISIGFFHT